MAEARDIRPDFVLWVERHNLKYWNLTVWMFDRNVHVHCCESTPSYECWPIETRANLEEEFEDDEDLRDEIDTAVRAGGDDDIKYVHVRGMDRLMANHPERLKVLGDTGKGVPYEEESYDEQRQAAIEYCQCNQQI